MRNQIRNKIILCTTILFCVLSMGLTAQQNWGNTQYTFNLYDVNLAYAGNHGVSSFGLRHRSQWLGVEGAPVTQQLSWNAPVFKEKIGVGASIQSEQIGLRNQQTAKVSAAYKLTMANGNLSVGFAFGFARQAFDKEALVAQDPQDVRVITIGNPILTPVVDAAVFYNTTKIYIGAEFGRIDRSGFNYSQETQARNYYHIRAVAGYKYKIGDKDIIEVSTLTKYAESNQVQIEGTVQYTRSNFLLLGAGYRLGTAAYILAGCNISSQLRFGLSYDFNIGSQIVKNPGGIEGYLGYNLKNNSGKSIRYF